MQSRGGGKKIHRRGGNLKAQAFSPQPRLGVILSSLIAEKKNSSWEGGGARGSFKRYNRARKNNKEKRELSLLGKRKRDHTRASSPEHDKFTGEGKKMEDAPGGEAHHERLPWFILKKGPSLLRKGLIRIKGEHKGCRTRIWKGGSSSR